MDWLAGHRWAQGTEVTKLRAGVGYESESEKTLLKHKEMNKEESLIPFLIHIFTYIHTYYEIP